MTVLVAHGRSCHRARAPAFVLLLLLALAGCTDEAGNSYSPWLVLSPSLLFKHSQTAFEALVHDQGSLRVKLNRGLAPDLIGPTGMPLLHSAIQLSEIESLRSLLEHNADPGISDTHNRSAWFYAFAHSSDAYVNALESSAHRFELGADENLPDLVISLTNSHLLKERVKKLVRWPIDWSAANKAGTRPLDVLIATGELELISLVVGHGANPQLISHTSMELALAPESEAVLRYLLGVGADPNSENKQGRSLLYAAIERENLEAVELLLRNGAQPNGAQDFDPQQLALLKGQSGLAIYLLQRGSDPDALHGKRSAVDVAELMLDDVYLKALERVEPASTLQINPGLDKYLRKSVQRIPEDRKWSPAVTREVKALQRSLGLPAHGHPSAFLLAAIQQRNDLNEFMSAAQLDELPVVQDLYRSNAQLVNARDNFGWTALMHASYRGNVRAVKKLLDLGAPLSAVDKQGSDALLLAIVSRTSTREAKQATIEALVNVGARSTVANKDGLTAVAAARRLGPAVEAAVTGRKLQPLGQVFVAVMGRPGTKNQSYHCDTQLPVDWMKQQWNAKLDIEDISRMGQLWCVVMGKAFNAGRAESFSIAKSPKQLDSAWGESTGKGKVLVDVDTGDFVQNSKWREIVEIYAEPAVPTVRQGYFVSDGRNLKEQVQKTVWDRGMAIDQIAPYGDQWWVLYGNQRGYYGQKYYYSDSFQPVIDFVGDHWKDDYHVTSLVKNEQQWMLVMSQGANLKDQTIVAADSYAELRQRIDERWKDGWRLNLLSAGALP